MAEVTEKREKSEEDEEEQEERPAKRIKPDEEKSNGHDIEQQATNEADATEEDDAAPEPDMAAATLVDPAAEPPTEDVPSTKETVELSAKEPVNESLKEQTTTESPVPKKAITTPAPKADIPAGVPSGLPSLDPAVQPTVTNPEAMVEERGNVSSLYVGRVIGKGGEMIRDLQARSGCRIDVDQNVPQGQPRIITYRGTRRTVEDAKKMVSLLCQEDGNETLLPIGEAKRKQMSVPSSSIGKIIGRGGEMIRELQNKSQAKIQVDHSGNSQQGNMRSMTITGTSQAVLKAEEMVLFLVANPLMDATVSINMLMDDKAKNGGRWGSGPPYLNMPNHGQNMMPQGQQPPQQQQQHQPNPYGGGGGGYGQGGPPAGGGGYPGYQQQQQQPPPHQGGGSGHYGMPPPQQSYFGMPGASEVEVFFAAKMYMGRIIGQRGVTINDVQKRSGCDIQVNQNVSPGQDCEITINGSRQGIESVKQMIREIIEMGPNHPYAGGQGQYNVGPGVGVGGGNNGGGYPPFQPSGYGGAPPQAYGGYQQQPPMQQPMYGQVPHVGPSPYGVQQPAYPPQQPYGQSMPIGGMPIYQKPPMQQYGQQPQYGQPSQQYQPTPQQQYPPQAPMVVIPPAVVWKSAKTGDGQVYYYNEKTGETQWDKPAGMP